MPSDVLLGVLEIVVRAALVAVTGLTVFVSIGVAVALLVTRPKRVVEVPVASPEPRPAVAPADTRSTLRPTAA